MTAEIIVVEEAESKDKVEAMARRRYSDIPPLALESGEFRVRTDGSEWANHIAPTIRCVAGHRDNGTGCWTHDGQIALIADGDELDTPAEAETLTASQYAQELHRVYRDTAHEEYSRQRQNYLADHKETTDA
jgi:hypothetical protein